MDMKLEVPDSVTVSIHSPLEEPFSVKLKLDYSLTPTIRDKLKMDKKLLFLDKGSCIIKPENEDGFKLRDIVKEEGSEKTYQLYLSRKPEDVVPVSVHSALEESFWVKLKLDDNLSTIRKELASKMDKKLLFLNKDCFIQSEDEDKFILREIVKEGPEKTYQLYLKVKIWEYLNEKHRLDHGCKGSKIAENEISRAEKGAFTMIDCKSSPCLNYRAIKNNNKDYQKADTSLSGNADFSFVSFDISRNKGNENETNLLDETIYYSKLCLEFEKYLEPTEDFIEEVKGIKDSKTFKEIIEKYGQFIPTKIIMGGKIHNEEIARLKNNSKGYSANAGINMNTGYVNIGMGAGVSSSSLNENSSQRREESYDGIEGDEKNWACIIHENCINIFELLSNNPKYNYLREKIFSAIGQRILYSKIETVDYMLNGCGPYIGEFKKIPADILNRDDCYVFAVILDAKGKKNDFFNCQIYRRDGTPKYIIRCIQIDQIFFNFFKFSTTSYNCELKIKYMVVGKYTDFKSIKYDELNSDIQIEVIERNYNHNQTKCSNKELLDFKSDLLVSFIGIPVLKDLNQGNSIIGHHFYTDQNDIVGVFTFSYSLDQKKYVNSPNFSFHILKISNLKREQFDYNNYQIYNGIINHPKYFSLHSKDVFGPIFFKYTINEIKLKVVACECKRCGVCMNSLKISKDKINFVYFELPDEKSS